MFNKFRLGMLIDAISSSMPIQMGLGIEFDEFGQFVLLELLEAFLFVFGGDVGRESRTKSPFGCDIQTEGAIVIADVVEDDAVGVVLVGDFPSD